jgi:bile acid-coenzyme A ligase
MVIASASQPGAAGQTSTQPATAVGVNPFEDGIPFGTKLQDLAEQRRDDTAVTVVALNSSTQTLTFGELDARANQWGRALAARGVETGSLVAIAIPNSVHLVLATLGCWKVGAVPIPMHWDLPEWERDRVRAVIEPAVVVDDSSRWELAALAATQPEGPLPTAISPTANGICSSGSTGVPKVILNLAPSLWIPEQGDPFLANWTPVAKPQIIMVPAPMYHTNGFATFLMLLGGDHLVILEKFDAALFVDTIERFRITNFTATPTMLARVAALPDIRQRDLSSVVFILQGAAVMPPSLLRTWFELLSPEQIVTAYGMTENLGLTALRGDEWLTHPGSVGRGFRDTEIRILDADKKPLGPGEDGDVYLRAAMSAGYRYLGGAPPLPSTEDGFRTAGDIGHLDEDGFLYIVDRRADMIVTGGANVFPAEVESALSGHPDIADVVVIGLSDERWGRRVHAVVQASPNADAPLTEQQVIDYAKSRLAPYKAPKTVEFVDAIPRTAATKVNRSGMVAARGG